MELKVISKSGVLPEYKSSGAAGFDISAFIEKDFSLAPGCRALIPTGLYFEVSSGYEAQIRARSGLAINHGIGVVNGIGTVDSDYRGEIKVPLINWSDEEFTIRNGDRIAQVVIAEAKQVTIRPVDELSDSERGTGGFGHTGI